MMYNPIYYEARVRFGTRVRVRDSAIFEKVECGCGGTRRLKNYLKYFYLYFLYIFTIKIFLKNTLLCLDSQNKERRQEPPLRLEFRLFQQVSRPISAYFGHFRPVSTILVAGRYDSIWPKRPDSGRISPVWRESKPIRRESSRVGTN